MKRVVTVLVIATGIVGGAVLLAARRDRRPIDQKAANADGTVAYVLLDDPADGTNGTAVALRRRFSPVRQEVFHAQNYGGKVRVVWMDDTHLLIQCERCQDRPYRYLLAHELNGVHISAVKAPWEVIEPY